ncbi:AbfB domain-containing protein [Saccharothrix texasensis]|uniref:Alpha-L-arabinofuranosidase B-like protein n=1 Tax=Saccharothrix texasensis TaxID=103734 RepID=A0A3N1GXL9_9PSEU|nr:AbfB domain-containing protein [Saccharothrix texasensis]ROP34977.1 alpha-L-arabinofuranosidase B-like protein [Saccharothrix texasensis]
MGHVGPAFGNAVVSDHQVFNSWGVNGDTPSAFRVHPNPRASAETLPDTVLNGYTWSNLPSGTLLTFTVDCVYPDGDVRGASFQARTTGPLGPPPAARAPSGLHVATYANETATLAWTNNAGYDKVLLRWGVGAPDDSQTDLPGNSTRRDVGGLTSSHAYVFQVKALQSEGPHDYTAWTKIHWQAPVTWKFRSANFPDRYLRHRNWLGELTPPDHPADDFRFTLLDRGGDQVALQSVNYPDRCLRHQDFRIKLQGPAGAGDPTWVDDSTFHLVDGLADAGGVSLRSKNFPDRYLRHRDFKLYLEPAVDPTARADATFYRSN